jgi:hypothetical protein
MKGEQIRQPCAVWGTPCPQNDPRCKCRPKLCGRIMVGSGTDTYDPLCELPAGHGGMCKSTAAVDQHRLQSGRKRVAQP